MTKGYSLCGDVNKPVRLSVIDDVHIHAKGNRTLTEGERSKQISSCIKIKEKKENNHKT